MNDGDDASSGYGYLDIVDFIIQHGSNIERNLEELYRRVAFYILIGNADDHFRNHGFLLTEKGWELSPAYDINPTASEQQSLLINRSTNEANLELLLDAASDFMLAEHTAKSIIGKNSHGFMAHRSKKILSPSARYRYFRTTNRQVAEIEELTYAKRNPENPGTN